MNGNETIFRVRAIILDGDKILLVKHKGNDFYALPGGKVDPGERSKTAIKRELFEELGVEAEIGKMLFVHEFSYEKNRFGETGEKNNIEFFFEVKNGKDFIGGVGDFAEIELDDIKWFTISEIGGLKPAFLKEKLLEGLEKIKDNFYSY
ncbi:NUDIX domain-containing protein [Candidatus Gracilibacteria bacterium]|nr:NUDIX domain-containing protein [Candidatus Gracilibacteria bacterium]